MDTRPRIAPESRLDGTPFIRPVDDARLDDDVAVIFEEIHQYYGFVPNLYATLAHFPPLLRANWQKVRAVMGGGPLGERTREAIAVTVSQANDCEYCVRIHSGALRRLEVPTAQIKALLQQRFGDVDFLSGKEKALVRFALKVNNSPPSVDREDVEGLRGTGATDAEIVHALGVMEVYIAYNKCLVALRVDVEHRDRVRRISYRPYC